MVACGNKADKKEEKKADSIVTAPVDTNKMAPVDTTNKMAPADTTHK